jgi:hypothetical protein
MEVVMSVPSVGLDNCEKQIGKPLAVSMTAACQIMSLGRTSMFALIKAGRVKTVNIGRRRLVVYASLEALLSEARPAS